MLVCQHIHVFIILQQSLSLPAEVILKILISGIMRSDFYFIRRTGKRVFEVFGVVNGFQIIPVAAHHRTDAQNFFDGLNFTFVNHSLQNVMKFFHTQVRRIEVTAFCSFDSLKDFHGF